MAKSRGEIIEDIAAFMRKHKGKPAQWYVGVSEDPKRDLFQTHGFKSGDKGLMRTAETELQAGEAAEYFIDAGCSGTCNPRPGMLYVYAYKRAKHTRP